jgi:glycosyltransferase involved in cell wall biosynthesis
MTLTSAMTSSACSGQTCTSWPSRITTFYEFGEESTELRRILSAEAPASRAGGDPGGELVSVVIPTRNRWNLLSRALASVLAQEGVALEVIVVDEGSSDETPERLAAIDDERVRTLRNDEPTGVARARNRGVEAARGEWVAFLDDDDFWAPTKLRVQLDACAATGAAFSYTGLVTTDPSLERRRVSAPFPAAGLERTILDMNLVGPPSSVIARRSLVTEAGGFDPELSILADWDMWIRLATAAPAIACDEPLTGYLSHPENMHLDAEAAIAELRRLRVKHAALADALGVRIGGERWLAWIATSLRRSGHRFRAAGLFLWVGLRWRHPELLARAAGTLAGDRAVGGVRRLWPAPDHAAGGEARWVDAFTTAAEPLR